MTLTLNPEAVDLATLRQLWQASAAKRDEPSMDRIRASAASVERIVASLLAKLATLNAKRPMPAFQP